MFLRIRNAKCIFPCLSQTREEPQRPNNGFRVSMHRCPKTTRNRYRCRIRFFDEVSNIDKVDGRSPRGLTLHPRASSSFRIVRTVKASNVSYRLVSRSLVSRHLSLAGALLLGIEITNFRFILDDVLTG